MKNIQVIDGATNSVYDIFAATDEEFDLIFLQGTDIAFMDEVLIAADAAALKFALDSIWSRRVAKKDAMGIHGMLFYGLEEKKPYYASRRDEEAANPDGSALR